MLLLQLFRKIWFWLL